MAVAGHDEDEQEEFKMDTLDDSLCLLKVRGQGTVYERAHWHRWVHVWVLDLTGASVLLVQRSQQAIPFRGLWTCCMGPVAEGEPSLLSAQKILARDLKLQYDDDRFEFLFSCKDAQVWEGTWLRHCIDVYIVPLTKSLNSEDLGFEHDCVSDVRYTTVNEIASAFLTGDPSYVISQCPEYNYRLLRSLNKLFIDYHKQRPADDSDDEREHHQAMQLLDRLTETGEVGEAATKGEVHRQSEWHRQAHIWLFDLESGSVLLRQKPLRRKNFGGCWNCLNALVEAGESSTMAAFQSLKEDIGLRDCQPSDLEFVFQCKIELQAVEDCLLRQVADVYCVLIPRESLPKAPAISDLRFHSGECVAARYMPVAELEDIWRGKQEADDLIIPLDSGRVEYADRLFFYFRQQLRKAQKALAPP
eukprot:CAMPEP_0206458886 /NCGR_PEP_ID=MMETSP0324_2-20121206/23842_1 /ASSEMBLY_ACC=CAM_ASM_000836 /TAXON_ID=2866 /ORGANISM="Crypthecodinium cohnii, Strain Seligo" /LENGTH=415 /DNA_ID=CAMNT_0053930321 /DNA_START=29 /DNA_END=1276 /DNA_ORIENTATION=-